MHHLHRALLGTVAGVGLASNAIAADIPARMPVKAPAAPVQTFSWTGCYLGGHVGWGWSDTKFSETAHPPSFLFSLIGDPPVTIRADGFLGGVQGGCDYQFAANWLVGIEGQFSWADIDRDVINPFFSGKGTRAFVKTDWLSNVTGRLGYAAGPWLFYAKGGVAWAHDHYKLQH